MRLPLVLLALAGCAAPPPPVAPVHAAPVPTVRTAVRARRDMVCYIGAESRYRCREGLPGAECAGVEADDFGFIRCDVPDPATGF